MTRNMEAVVRVAVLLIVCGLLMPHTLFATEFDLRKAKWGMTKEEVRASEGNKNTVEESPTLLSFKERVNNQEVLINYAFSDDKLVGALYVLRYYRAGIIPLPHVGNSILEDYFSAQTQVSQKLGSPEPEMVTTEWSDEQFKDKHNLHGLALIKGHLTHKTIWESDRSQIALATMSDGKETALVMGLKSKEHTELFEKLQAEEKKLKELLDSTPTDSALVSP